MFFLKTVIMANTSLDLAETIAQKIDLDPEETDSAIDLCAKAGKEIMLKEIQQALARFRVNFDVWSCESDLHASGLLEKTLQSLQKRRASI